MRRRTFSAAPSSRCASSRCLIGLLTIPLVYQLARATAGERAGRYAALLAAISAPLWWASQEARMYTLLALLVLICALAWQRLVTKPARVAWLASLAGRIGAALRAQHGTGDRDLAQRRHAAVLDRPAQHQPPGLARLDRWAGWRWAALVPYFVDRFLAVQSANSAITSAPPISLAFAWQVWQGLWVEPWALALRQPADFCAAGRGSVFAELLLSSGGGRRGCSCT